jgi:hypothetical protein
MECEVYEICCRSWRAFGFVDGRLEGRFLCAGKKRRDAKLNEQRERQPGKTSAKTNNVSMCTETIFLPAKQQSRLWMGAAYPTTSVGFLP